MKLLYYMAVCLSALSLVTCSPSKTEVSGEVFIVSTRGESRKLSLVQVTALPEDVIRTYLESKQSTFDEAREYTDHVQQNCRESADCGAKFLEAMDGMRSLYFDGLPANWAARTETDSNGKFKMTLPKPGRYAILATAKDGNGKYDQKYYWLVWVSARGVPTSVTLSNNNQLGNHSPAEILATN